MDNVIRDYWPTNEWRNCCPEDKGMDSSLFFNIDEKIRKEEKNINSLLVIKGGYVIFEKYYNGLNQTSVQHVMSVTKSVVSALIGIAIDKGFIENVDKKIFDIIPEYLSKDRDSLSGEITLGELLTMTSGMKWQNRYMGEPLLDGLIKSTNWVEYILNLAVDEKRKGRFQYNSSSSHLLSAIITKTTGMNAEAFAGKYLFKKIGIKLMKDNPDFKDSSNTSSDTVNKEKGIVNLSYRKFSERNWGAWGKDPQGNNTGGFGLSLTSRDMARFGYLYLNNGYWDGEQIISEKWVMESTKPQAKGNEIGSYGYQWWIKNRENPRIYSAIGYGGQYITNIPEMDLTVVVTSGTCQRKWQDPFWIVEKLL